MKSSHFAAPTNLVSPKLQALSESKPVSNSVVGGFEDESSTCQPPTFMGRSLVSGLLTKRSIRFGLPYEP
jgi:hypothetical protein